MSCVGLRGFYVCVDVWGALQQKHHDRNSWYKFYLTHLFHSVSVWDWCALVKESNGILEPDLSFLFGFWIDS